MDFNGESGAKDLEKAKQSVERLRDLANGRETGDIDVELEIFRLNQALSKLGYNMNEDAAYHAVNLGGIEEYEKVKHDACVCQAQEEAQMLQSARDSIDDIAQELKSILELAGYNVQADSAYQAAGLSGVKGYEQAKHDAHIREADSEIQNLRRGNAGNEVEVNIMSRRINTAVKKAGYDIERPEGRNWADAAFKQLGFDGGVDEYQRFLDQVKLAAPASSTQMEPPHSIL